MKKSQQLGEHPTETNDSSWSFYGVHVTGESTVHGPFQIPSWPKKGETGFKLVLSHGKMILEISRTYLTYYEKKRRVTITCADLC